MSAKLYRGSCLCGQLGFEAAGELYDLCFCHCNSCRLASGAPYVAWGTVDFKAFKVTHGELSHCRSSTDVSRGFCHRCGTSVTYQHAKRLHEIDLALVTLERAEDLAPGCHLWIADKLPWVELADGLPQYSEWRVG